VMTHFERGLYAQPDGDHDDRWWDLVERFQLVQRPDGRHAPDWAAKIHIAAAPVYYHNYLFGEMIASQLAASLGGLVENDRAGRAFLGSRPTWLWGVEHGVNDHGVAIGNEKIWTVDRPREQPPALLGMDLVRLGLERARSAEEALTVVTTLLERHGQGGSGEPHRDEPYFSSFLLADPDAGFVVETSNRTWAARPIGGGAAISNRVSLTTDWTRASSNIAADVDFDTYRRTRMPTAIADHRLELTSATVARGNATT